MSIELSSLDCLLKELTSTWHKTIPLSEFMQVSADEYDEYQLSVSAPLAPNINLHQTMFAGSIYTLMTLTGWGVIWLQQKQQQVTGDIVLAKADVRYIAPINERPKAVVTWPNIDLSVLEKGHRVKCKLLVELYCNDKLCASFEGVYITTPRK
ncbi:thioesterase domain-containing protein [Shewanella surugensis]|uniref:Thioesterase domain-containing protein n=1 Tax=Shewanella surugensis TaxID=212020 RepID=A0ABT0LCX5_9GAMM|nr:thioesterase domain-containing protein [Shewanella surugensis]MCL1125170.1 thioesterase domain-containing protein [Shewanella surugensis]